jgi:hypothetical protein
MNPATCEGRLVAHFGGAVAFCTEELKGGYCPGYHRSHQAEELCWLAAADAPCMACEMGRTAISGFFVSE